MAAIEQKYFVENWISKIHSSGIKQFPFYYIDESQLDTILIPVKTLLVGREFFGAYDVITTDGQPIYHASNVDEAKFFVYSSKERNGKAYLPKDKSKIKNLLNAYNHYLDELLNQIKLDYKQYFPEGKNLQAISNEIFKKINVIRY